MTPAEAFRSALDNLAAHKLRSALTMLGMIFGVGAVIAMLSIGAGAERQALQMVERLGLSNVLVRARTFKDDELKEIRAKSPGLSERDVEAIAEAVPGVELAAPNVRVDPWAVLSDEGKARGAVVYGVAPRHAELAHLSLAEGRFLDALDERTHAQVCVLGPQARRELFGFGPALGRDVKVDDLWLEVVGVLAPTGGGDSFEGVDVGSVGNALFLPLSTAARKLARPPLASPLDGIVIHLKPGVSGTASAPVVKDLLDRLHGGADDYELVVPEALLEQSRRTQRLFDVVMGAIAGISLLVGGIGIMNIMLATVLERTHEIGLRRAVGAKAADIRFQFMVESFAISLLGGLAGVLVGLGIARGVAAYAGWRTLVTLTSIVVSTGVAMGVGLASGLYPATRAAALDPIDALRYE